MIPKEKTIYPVSALHLLFPDWQDTAEQNPYDVCPGSDTYFRVLPDGLETLTAEEALRCVREDGYVLGDCPHPFNGKVLLKVTNIKDGICAAECDCENEEEKLRLASSILSLMDKDGDIAAALTKAVLLYMNKREVVSRLNEKAIRSAEMKTKN